MKNRYLATLLAAFAFTAAYAEDAPTMITEMPKGKVVNLYRSTTGFEAFYGNAMASSSTGDWQRMVFGDDGAVYLENPINSFYSQTWIKGNVTTNDTIAFEFPQCIYSEEYKGKVSYGYAKLMRLTTEGSKKTYAVDPDTQTLKFVWRDNKLVKVSEDIVGMCLESDGWTGYGEDSYEAYALDDNTLCPPASAQVKDGLMLYMDLDGNSLQYPVKYCLDGNTAWLGNLTANMKDHWIKGEFKDNTATFPASSYLGLDTITRSYIYVSSVDSKKAENNVGTDYDSVFVVNDPIVFTYKTNDKTLSSRGAMAVHKSSDDLRSTNIFDFYKYGYVQPWVSEEAAPMPPIPTGYMPWDPSYAYAGVEFKLSYYSVNGNYLDPAYLFYNIYIDGERLTFTPDEYTFVSQDMTDVPFSYKDQYDFYELDENNRRVYFYHEPKEKIGIESLYIKGDKRLSSGITEYTIPNETGIDSNVMNEKSIESVAYYDLSGRRVSRPTKGIYVRTITLADGSKESKKIVK